MRSTQGNGNATKPPPAGTERNGLVIGMNSELSASSQPNLAHAQRNFARLMAYVANLYFMGGLSSVSAREMMQLTAPENSSLI